VSWLDEVAATIVRRSMVHGLNKLCFRPDRLCGLVFRVPGYRSRGPGSIPGATRFSEK
jgi:hypothetical protein